MADADFGERLQHGQPFYDVVRLAPKIKAVAAQIVLRDRYETLYGIHNHEVVDANHQIPLAAMWDCEDARTGSLMDERMSQFAEKHVGKHFNISWPEFMELPTDQCYRMLEIASKLKNIEQNSIETQLSLLGQRAPGGNQP